MYQESNLINHTKGFEYLSADFTIIWLHIIPLRSGQPRLLKTFSGLVFLCCAIFRVFSCFFVFFRVFSCFFVFSLHLPIGPLALTPFVAREKPNCRLGYRRLLTSLHRFGLSLLAKTAERRFGPLRLRQLIGPVDVVGGDIFVLFVTALTITFLKSRPAAPSFHRRGDGLLGLVRKDLRANGGDESVSLGALARDLKLLGLVVPPQRVDVVIRPSDGSENRNRAVNRSATSCHAKRLDVAEIHLNRPHLCGQVVGDLGALLLCVGGNLDRWDDTTGTVPHDIVVKSTI